MAKRIKKAIPWFLVASILLVSLIVGLNSWIQNVKADDAAGTSANVTNTAPSFDVVPTDEDEGNGGPSTDDNPTNVGSDVKFRATGDDPNTEQYYLSVCKSAGITPQANAAGDCGIDDSWCYSAVADDKVEAFCTYATQAADAPSQAWHAYACDHRATGSACSAVSQGTDDSGTPFYVNQRPTFDAISVTDDTPDPGDVITVNTTTNDLDAGDTVKLYVCKELGFDGTQCTDAAGEWCNDTTTGDDPHCDITVPTPSEGADTYYGYIVDNHGFQATGGQQGVEKTFTVNNVAPVVSAVKLNDDVEMTLTQAHGDTPNYTDLYVTGTVTDDNGCEDIVTVDTLADVFTDDMAHDLCDIDGEDDDNDCYALTGCALDGGSCTGGADLGSTYTCKVSFLYHADPTVANTPKAANLWTAFLKSKDETADATPVGAGTKVEMNDNVALDVTASIAYGSLAVGAIAGGTALPQTTTVTATGNTALDLKLHAEKKMCTDYPTCTPKDATHTPIAQSQQHYAASGTWTDGNPLASSLPGVAYQLNCKKTTGTAPENPATKDVKWGLQVPDLTLSGGYEGSDTFTAVMGDNPGTQW